MRPTRRPASLLAFAGIVVGAVACSAQVQATVEGPPSAVGPGAPDLVRVADSVLSTPPMDQLHWGILFRDLSTGEELYRANGSRKFIPASIVKLPVALAALDLLGPDYRWETALWAAGDVTPDGTLVGDLLLPATADPTLSERFHPDDRAPLDSLAVRLLRSGVRRVEGDLVVDVSRWDSVTVPGSWMVEDLGGWWGSTPGAFGVAEGEVRIEVRPGRLGRPAELRAWPPALSDPFLDVRITTVHPDSTTELDTRYLPGSGRLVVRGTVEAGPVDTLRISARDPVGVAARALGDALREAGVDLRGSVRVVVDPDSARAAYPVHRRLAALRSPPLSEVVRALLEPSQNWIAEQLLVTLGQEHLPDPVEGWMGAGMEGTDPRPPEWAPPSGGEDAPSTRREWALELVEGYLVHRVGVDSLDVRLRDASGLSTQNLVTPRSVVRMLEYGSAAPWRDVLLDALASPGEEESTLEHRLRGLEPRVWAKTGTLTNVVALSGFIRTAGGRTLVFSVLVNGSGLPASPVQRAVDTVVRAAAR